MSAGQSLAKLLLMAVPISVGRGMCFPLKDTSHRNSALLFRGSYWAGSLAAQGSDQSIGAFPCWLFLFVASSSSPSCGPLPGIHMHTHSHFQLRKLSSMHLQVLSGPSHQSMFEEQCRRTT